MNKNNKIIISYLLLVALLAMEFFWYPQTTYADAGIVGGTDVTSACQSAGGLTSCALTLNQQPVATDAVIVNVYVAATAPINFSASGAGCTWSDWGGGFNGNVVNSHGARSAAILLGNNCSGSGGTTVTVSYTSTTNTVRVEGYEVKGLDTSSSPVDGSSATGSTSGATISTNSITPKRSAVLCDAVASALSGGTFVSGPTNSWVALSSPGGNAAGRAAYKITNYITSQSTSWKYTSSSLTGDAEIACFKWMPPTQHIAVRGKINMRGKIKLR